MFDFIGRILIFLKVIDNRVTKQAPSVFPLELVSEFAFAADTLPKEKVDEEDSHFPSEESDQDGTPSNEISDTILLFNVRAAGVCHMWSLQFTKPSKTFPVHWG